MQRSLLTRLLLIFALLFVQLGSLTHGISHMLDNRGKQSDQSLPHDKHCDLCVAYAHIGSAIGSSETGLISNENHELTFLSDTCCYISTTFVAFAARAPPYSV